ncbi:hypothetical protein [Endozoicomonas ascidiicola]|uniref:hypothetical protein n=1 Tax=Endozoicomonas ascidiicola TaxID=1698521 RepID=UPI000836EDFE|nr:hypothetical protein [Endozoicomonas ascidiicola]
MHRLTLLFFLIGFTFTTQASFRETYALSEPIYQALESARELAAGEQYQSALNINQNSLETIGFILVLA